VTVRGSRPFPDVLAAALRNNQRHEDVRLRYRENFSAASAPPSHDRHHSLLYAGAFVGGRADSHGVASSRPRPARRERWGLDDRAFSPCLKRFNVRCRSPLYRGSSGSSGNKGNSQLSACGDRSATVSGPMITPKYLKIEAILLPYRRFESCSLRHPVCLRRAFFDLAPRTAAFRAVSQSSQTRERALHRETRPNSRGFSVAR
jgi:hypothetical protein